MRRHRLTVAILNIFILLGISWAGTDRTDEVKRIRAAANVHSRFSGNRGYPV